MGQRSCRAVKKSSCGREKLSFVLFSLHLLCQSSLAPTIFFFSLPPPTLPALAWSDLLLLELLPQRARHLPAPGRTPYVSRGYSKPFGKPQAIPPPPHYEDPTFGPSWPTSFSPPMSCRRPGSSPGSPWTSAGSTPTTTTRRRRRRRRRRGPASPPPQHPALSAGC